MHEHSSQVKGFALVVVQRRTAGRAEREISARSGPIRSLARTFPVEKFESSGHFPEVMRFRGLSKLRLSFLSRWNRYRRDFASVDPLFVAGEVIFSGSVTSFFQLSSIRVIKESISCLSSGLSLVVEYNSK